MIRVGFAYEWGALTYSGSGGLVVAVTLGFRHIDKIWPWQNAFTCPIFCTELWTRLGGVTIPRPVLVAVKSADVSIVNGAIILRANVL